MGPGGPRRTEQGMAATRHITSPHARTSTARSTYRYALGNRAHNSWLRVCPRHGTISTILPLSVPILIIPKRKGRVRQSSKRSSDGTSSDTRTRHPFLFLYHIHQTGRPRVNVNRLLLSLIHMDSSRFSDDIIIVADDHNSVSGSAVVVPTVLPPFGIAAASVPLPK